MIFLVAVGLKSLNHSSFRLLWFIQKMVYKEASDYAIVSFWTKDNF